MSGNMKNIPPNRIILNLTPKKCEKCENIQHVFFKSKKEMKNWECPVCKENIIKKVDLSGK